jgi:hypothetical protein
MPYITLNKQDGTEEQIEWTPYPRPKFRIKRLQKVGSLNPYSIDEEAIAILKGWYSLNGLNGPSEEEISACRGTDAANAQAEVVAQQQQPPAKLEYGTPEFWKDWWRKKKEKEAKAAALLQKAQAEFAALQVKEA